MKHPIPEEALDDRLAIVGTAGSGKTYLTIGSMSRLLERKSRVIGVDALGVMWGLRLMPDGKTPSPFDIVIFGGPHGDLPLTEHAGAVIGETVATMRESCILDLSQLGTKAAERRFMLAFLTSLYRHANKEPVHLVVDEADMWAPQRLLDKEGEAAKLLGMMETIVRRGRVKGFIPWLVTQRPAVLSKDVLSQADGLVALKLTAKQDHDAVGGWIEATADRSTWQAIKSALPTKQRGEGVLWIPARSVLEDVTFPPNETFDSSRTPKRGEKRQAAELRPIDLGKLKERLSSVEAETKASDPKALKAEISRLTAELKKASSAKAPAPTDPLIIAKAEAAGYARGRADGLAEGFDNGAAEMWRSAEKALKEAKFFLDNPPKLARADHVPDAGKKVAIEPAKPATRELPIPARAPRTAPSATKAQLTPAKQRILDALAWAGSLGQSSVTRELVAFLADTSPKSSAYANNVSSLRVAGLIDYPSQGSLSLTDTGSAQAEAPTETLSHDAIMSKVAGSLTPAHMRILRAATHAYPDSLDRAELAERASTSPTSSAFANNVSRLRTLGLIDYPSTGFVRAEDRLFP